MRDYLMEKLEWADGAHKSIRQTNLRALWMSFLSSFSPRFDTPKKENKVAYLDGLRGFAAFMVYWVHHSNFSHRDEKRYYHSFGFRDEYLFSCLPVVRFFFAGGNFAVALFFVISGYVLSVSPLSSLHTRRPGDGNRLSMALGASFPRRWLRLYLPVITTTFVFMTLWHLLNIRTIQVAPESTWLAELARWFDELRQGSYFYLQSETPAFGHSNYNHHIWTIAVEYRGSAIIYVTMLVFYALGYGTNTRLFATLGLFSYFLFIVDGPWYALFTIGMFIADLDLAWEHNPNQLHRFFKSDILQRHNWIIYVLFASALYVGCAPLVSTKEAMAFEPGWYFLSYLAPYTITNVRDFYPVYGAPICVMCIPRITWLKRMFESSFFQFLGKVSFGFYLVHGPVMWTIGDRVYAAVGRPTPVAERTAPGWTNLFPLSDAGPLGFEINSLVPHLILLPITLWLAVFVTKVVDVPSLRLSKRLFKQQSLKPSDGEMEGDLAPMLPKYTEHQIQ